MLTRYSYLPLYAYIQRSTSVDSDDTTRLLFPATLPLPTAIVLVLSPQLRHPTSQTPKKLRIRSPLPAVTRAVPARRSCSAR
ncbi:hypothetical protein PC116_g11246 [Phytophthora cactorum]|nr:hypothetical protein PC119_g13380 [Phytophthora cactorum]KAG4240804.1 hypothetical protein PC116_g11246 [Phytophthora cactorum]